MSTIEIKICVTYNYPHNKHGVNEFICDKHAKSTKYGTQKNILSTILEFNYYFSIAITLYDEYLKNNLIIK